MQKEITVPIHVIIKDGGYQDYKEEEHKKVVKDPERARRRRKRIFGSEATGDPPLQNDPRHVIKKGRTIAGQDKEIDRSEFIKAAAKSDSIVQTAAQALRKAKK